MNIDNPFAILKVPANASAAEIKSAGKMMVADYG
jgi:curved DNA-binding protein CbpA